MWYKVAKVNDLQEGKGTQVEVPGKLIALFRVGGAFYAIKDECTHAGAALYDGDLKGFVIRCPLHGAQFDVRTGQSIGELAYNNVRSYKTRVSNDDIEVEI